MHGCYITIIEIVNYFAVSQFRITQGQSEIEERKKPHQALASPRLVFFLEIF